MRRCVPPQELFSLLGKLAHYVACQLTSARLRAEDDDNPEGDTKRRLPVIYRGTCIGMLAWSYPRPTDRMPGSRAPRNVVAIRSLPPLTLGSPSVEGKLRAKPAFRLYRECDRGAGSRPQALARHRGHRPGHPGEPDPCRDPDAAATLT